MDKFFSIVAASGTFLIANLGGSKSLIFTLLFFMGLDYLCGLFTPIIFGRSKRGGRHNKLSSTICIKGLFKKCYMLILIFCAYRLDLVVDGETFYIAQAVIIAFIVNELVSLLEHATIIGLPIPNVFKKALAVLNDKVGNDKAEGEKKNVD